MKRGSSTPRLLPTTKTKNKLVLFNTTFPGNDLLYKLPPLVLFSLRLS